MEEKNELRDSTIAFAVRTFEICQKIKGCAVYTNQLLRASSSIGANLFEAKYAQSRSDFIHKLEISLKECSETEFWLQLLFQTNRLPKEHFSELNNTRGIIQRKLISSITTAKTNGEEKDN